MTEIINKEAYGKLCNRNCEYQDLCDYDFCNFLWIAAEQAMLQKKSCKGCVYESPAYLPQPDFCNGCIRYSTRPDNYFNPKEK